ncbi:MAG: amidohydrolase family protein [Candidatus Bathyarchaeia archaeon]
MDKIDFESHFYTKSYVKTLLKRKWYPRYKKDATTDVYWLWYNSDVREPHTSMLLSKLLDTGRERFKDMEDAGIKMHVLSLSAPGCEQFDISMGKKLAKEVNNELSELIQKNPERFAGLAALAPQDPGEAADELERAVKDLGLLGWKTHSNICGTYLDDRKYWVIFEKAERLKVPIFLHPTVPRIREFRKNYGYALAGPAFGFTVETALCMMRLILSGLLDKYPRLTFVLGHLGETLPFLSNRLDFPFVRPWAAQNINIQLSKKPSQYLKDHIFIGTSGEFSISALMYSIKTMGCERVIFASDYPYEDSAKTVERIESLPFSEEEKTKIYHKNAAKILGIH